MKKIPEVVKGIKGKATTEIHEFMNQLPPHLRKPLSMHVYKDIHTSIDYLSGKNDEFLSWICPLLKTRNAEPGEQIYREGDALTSVYFVKSGTCNYVLPKYASRPFIKIV